MFRTLPLMLALFAVCVNADGDEVSKDVEQTKRVDPFANLKMELQKKWPQNRMVRFVFHGHSVPAGYFKTPEIRRFDSYPGLFHQTICQQYPTAVIDVCVTAIGGENAVSGSKRFAADVLSLRPDVVFIDYALNDRGVGLEKAEQAWREMIAACREAKVPVVLLTPTADASEDITSDAARLAGHAKQIRQLAAEFDVPLIDSYAAFREQVESGTEINELLSQRNHPNRAGHEIVAELLTKMFQSVGTL